MKHFITLLAITGLLFTGCMDTSGPDCVPIDQTSYLAEYAQMEGYTVTDSGLIYRVIEQGDGEIPPENYFVFFTFKANLVTESQPFARSNDLIFSPLNESLLPGLREGIGMMTEGSTYEFILPTELAYNNDPPPGSPIQCGAVIIYEITFDSFIRDVNTFLDQNAAREDVEVTESGLQYRIIEEGDGDNPGPTSTVNIFYEGSLTNGYVFDRTTGNTPAEFTISGVLPGFAEGLRLMNEGAKYQLFIPPNLGYGENPPRDSRGALVMPPNSVLIFDVEMVKIDPNGN